MTRGRPGKDERLGTRLAQAVVDKRDADARDLAAKILESAARRGK